MSEQTPTTNIRTKGDSYRFTKHTRRQDVVEVNKRELEELNELDWSSQTQMLLGQFFIGGGAWLAAEKGLERQQGEAIWTPIFSVSIGAAIVGVVLLVYGIFAWRMKSRRIKAIFDEMEELPDDD